MKQINILHIRKPLIKCILNNIKKQSNDFKEKFIDKNTKTTEQSVILNNNLENQE